MNRKIARLGLMGIVKKGHFPLVRFLVAEGLDLDQRDEEKRTILMMCAFMEPEEWGVGISRLLLENGASLHFRDRYGLNAFMYAVIYERVELVNVFLGAIDFKLNAADNLGNTALHYAVRSGNTNITRLIAKAFVKYGVSLDKRNNAGRTALNEAVLGNRRKCARVLETSEALTDITSIEANIPLDLKSVDYVHEASSFNGSKKSLVRPKTSILPIRSSTSSHLNREGSNRKSQTNSIDDTKRYMQLICPCKRHDIVSPHIKNKKNLIHNVGMTNIRISREYLFQMMSHFGINKEEPPQTRKLRVRSAFVRRSEVENELDARRSWRTEFQKLYLNYELKCTASYRNTAVPPPTPDNSEQDNEEIDIYRKKGRVKSAAVSRQVIDENVLGVGKNRNVPKSGSSKKLSQNIVHVGKLASVNDASVNSSNESLINLGSSKKQTDGKISKSGKENAVRRQSVPGIEDISKIKPLKGISE